MTQSNVSMIPIDDITIYDNNPRRNDHAVETMATMITKFGFRVPVLIKGENNELIDGHLRLKAARQAGLSSVPFLRADDMSKVARQ
jgi:ParB-like chromosome segregation protein Spo0J